MAQHARARRKGAPPQCVPAPGFEMGDEALDTALSTCANASTGCFFM